MLTFPCDLFVAQEDGLSTPWVDLDRLPFEELFYFIRMLIAKVVEEQIRNDECSMLTAVSVRSDGRTERTFNPILHVVPVMKSLHAAIWSQPRFTPGSSQSRVTMAKRLENAWYCRPTLVPCSICGPHSRWIP